MLWALRVLAGPLSMLGGRSRHCLMRHPGDVPPRLTVVTYCCTKSCTAYHVHRPLLPGSDMAASSMFSAGQAGGGPAAACFGALRTQPAGRWAALCGRGEAGRSCAACSAAMRRTLAVFSAIEGRQATRCGVLALAASRCRQWAGLSERCVLRLCAVRCGQAGLPRTCTQWERGD